MSKNLPPSVSDNIMACARHALVGNRSAALRRYSFTFDERSRLITMRAEVGRALTDDERDELNIAEGEINADLSLGEDTQVETVVDIVPPGQSLAPPSGRVVYAVM